MSGEFKSLSMQAIQVLRQAWPVILRAAILPYLLAVGIVVLARWVGAPERYALDGLHGVVVLTYITAMARIAAGTYPGATLASLCIPKPRWPGKTIFWAMVGDGLVLTIPAAFLLLVLAMNFGPFIAMTESLVLTVAASLVMEFILSTLIGLVIGAGLARAENA